MFFFDVQFAETVKSPADVDKEGAILSEMLEIVEQKDSLRSMLEEDRQRWALFLNLVDWARGSLDNSDGGGSASSEDDYDDVFFEDSGSLSLESGSEQEHEEHLEITDNEAVNNNKEIVDEFAKGDEEFEQLFGCSEYPDEHNSAGRDVGEFDRLVRELSEDSTTNSWNPTVEVDGSKVKLKDLVSAHELQMWTESAAAVAQEVDDDDDPVIELRRRPQRSASLTVTSCSSEEFYQRRLPKPNVTKNDPVITVDEARVITVVEADDDVKSEGSAEKDWGSLGVRFENRGVVRDLVWQWEYNHLQQSGRLGAVPDDNVGASRPVKRRSSRLSSNRLAPPTDHLLHSASSSDFESAGHSNKKKKKTRKRVTQLQESSKPMDDSDDNQWPFWQIGLLLWLVIFSIFVIYNLFFVSSWHPFFFF